MAIVQLKRSVQSVLLSLEMCEPVPRLVFRESLKDFVQQVSKATIFSTCTLLTKKYAIEKGLCIFIKMHRKQFQSLDHLSRALGNLEHRLLNELNYLRSMINMLLPPLYQQHYFAQPQPQLYQPLPSPPSNSSNSNSAQNSQTSEAVSHVSDQIQNESPYSVSPTSPPTSTDVPLTKNTTSAEDSTESITEKQLEFKPVQKKISDRNKSFPKLVKFLALNVPTF